MKNSGALNLQQAATQSLVSQSMHTSQTQINIPGALNKVGTTGISDNSFGNMTIRSTEKFNSTLGPVKLSAGSKAHQIANLEQQVHSTAQM